MNDLYFNDILLEEDLRALIGARMRENDMFDLFNGEINFVPLDTEGKSYSNLDAITLAIVSPSAYLTTRDDQQIQNHTMFTVEIEVYTTGKDKIKNNKLLCNTLIQLLQKPRKLKNYFNSGLILEEYVSGLGTMVENTTRSILRFTGLCDNRNLSIYSLNK